VSLTFDGFPTFSPPFLFFSNQAPSRPPGPLAIILPCMLYQVQVDCVMCRKGRHCDVSGNQKAPGLHCLLHRKAQGGVLLFCCRGECSWSEAFSGAVMNMLLVTMDHAKRD
jgi:hypothetical protein